MKFVIDAQLPRRLARRLVDMGHDAIHTLDLPRGNATTDSEIAELADIDKRIVVTKDADFVVSHTLHATPRQLLLIATGNIHNAALVDLVAAHLTQIETAFGTSSFIELHRTTLVSRP